MINRAYVEEQIGKTRTAYAFAVKRYPHLAHKLSRLQELLDLDNAKPGSIALQGVHVDQLKHDANGSRLAAMRLVRDHLREAEPSLSEASIHDRAREFIAKAWPR